MGQISDFVIEGVYCIKQIFAIIYINVICISTNFPNGLLN